MKTISHLIAVALATLALACASTSAPSPDASASATQWRVQSSNLEYQDYQSAFIEALASGEDIRAQDAHSVALEVPGQNWERAAVTLKADASAGEYRLTATLKRSDRQESHADLGKPADPEVLDYVARLFDKKGNELAQWNGKVVTPSHPSVRVEPRAARTSGRLEFLIPLTVSNANTFALVFDKINCALSLNDKEVLTSEFAYRTRIPPASQTMFDLGQTMEGSEHQDFLRAIQRSTGIDYRLNCEFVYHEQTHQFTLSGRTEFP